jgi:hypothetical protein
LIHVHQLGWRTVLEVSGAEINHLCFRNINFHVKVQTELLETIQQNLHVCNGFCNESHIISIHVRISTMMPRETDGRVTKANELVKLLNEKTKKSRTQRTTLLDPREGDDNTITKMAIHFDIKVSVTVQVLNGCQEGAPNTKTG